MLRMQRDALKWQSLVLRIIHAASICFRTRIYKRRYKDTGVVMCADVINRLLCSFEVKKFSFLENVLEFSSSTCSIDLSECSVVITETKTDIFIPACDSIIIICVIDFANRIEAKIYLILFTLLLNLKLSLCAVNQSRRNRVSDC